MRRKKSHRLRGSVTQNNISVRLREEASSGLLTRLGILLGVLVSVAGGFALAWHYGWPQSEARKLADAGIGLTQKAQFSVRDIAIEGRRETSRDAVSDALGTERGAPILTFDAKAAAARLSKLPWVESAVVEKQLPDTINVVLTEHEPLARWQHEDKLHVIDTGGNILSSANPGDFTALPLVVGVGADRNANDFITALRDYPDIYKLTDSAVRVGDRRWDLHLQPKITVKLPEDDVATALHRLSVLITQEKILDRDIQTVDLRLPDRLTFDPAPDALKHAQHEDFHK